MSALAFTPTDELLWLPFPRPGRRGELRHHLRALSKRANHLRVQAAAVTWGERGARVNSISSGIILTPLARAEMTGPGAAQYQAMIETSAAGRVGTTDEVAAAAAYLLDARAAPEALEESGPARRQPTCSPGMACWRSAAERSCSWS